MLDVQLPVISVQYEPTGHTEKSNIFEQDYYPCPYFILEMNSIDDTHNFIEQNPSLIKKLNLGHYVIILKQVIILLKGFCTRCNVL